MVTNRAPDGTACWSSRRRRGQMWWRGAATSDSRKWCPNKKAASEETAPYFMFL